MGLFLLDVTVLWCYVYFMSNSDDRRNEEQLEALLALADEASRAADMLKMNKNATVSTGTLSSQMTNIIAREGARAAMWKLNRRK